jgi:hypothetical protein
VSQYPSPYSQPYPQQSYPGQYNYYVPGADLLASAKRAAILMFVLGGLLALLGSCNSLSAMFLDSTEAYEKQQQLMGDTRGFAFSPQTMRSMTIGAGIGTLLVGVFLIALGAIVRRGSMAAIVTSLIIVSLIVILLLLLCLSAIIMAATGAGAIGAILLCVFAVPGILFILLDVWLAQAAFAVPKARAMQQAMANQMWQYQQQAAAAGWSYQQQSQQPMSPPPSEPPALPPTESHEPPAKE